MLSIQDLAVRYGARTLFENATLHFNAGERYGIVGANGSGKSTLLRVIAGQEEPTTGQVNIVRGKRVGVLEQDHFQYDDERIIDVVMMGHPELYEAMREKDEMLVAAAEDPAAFEVERYGELEDIVLAHDGYSFESRAADILEGLNIAADLHEQPLSVLSGGYKLRVLLAKTLAANPDILLLDEPTNHLDIVSIAWLEQFLQDFRGCALVISHDQHFLNAVSTQTVDVDYQEVRLYRGNYDFFEKAKVEERERKEHEIEKREAEIEKHEKFVERFRSKATKARQAQSRIKQIENIEIEELPSSSRQYPTFRFGAARDTGKVVLECENISKSFDDNEVLKGVGFDLHRGEKMAVIGPNGVGKSTLLNLALGHLDADEGSAEWGHAAHPGYFAQGHEEFRGHEDTTILDWLWSHFPDRPHGFIRGKLAEVLFGKEEVEKKIGALSGGELARLNFARLSIEEPTVLVLDEPTNHLDLEGIESLAEGLEQYPNAMLFVSHDRWFVSRLADRVLALTRDGVEDFRGGYDEFLAWNAAHHDRHLETVEGIR